MRLTTSTAFICDAKATAGLHVEVQKADVACHGCLNQVSLRFRLHLLGLARLLVSVKLFATLIILFDPTLREQGLFTA